jgi:hypothetical protein
MPVPFTGSEAGITTDRADVVIPIPLDGDPGNASTFNNTFQPIINFLQRVRKKAGFLDVASTWTQPQTYAGGFAANSSITAEFQGTEAAPGFFYKLATAARALGLKLTLTSGMACRFITTSTNAVIITINAAWDGSGWVADTPNVASLWFQLSSSGLTVKTYTAPNTNPFADGAFTTGVSIPGSGTKGQVLGFTADNVATMSNTIRYAERTLNTAGLSWSGVFSGNSNATILYRDVTGFAGITGGLGLAAGNFTGASPTTAYPVLTLPSSGPDAVYLPISGQKYPIVISVGTTFYTAYLYHTTTTEMRVIGLQPTDDPAHVDFGKIGWRTAT